MLGRILAKSLRKDEVFGDDEKKSKVKLKVRKMKQENRCAGALCALALVVLGLMVLMLGFNYPIIRIRL